MSGVSPSTCLPASRTPALSVGLLTADWMDLGRQIRGLERLGAPLLHFDVMDGRFCPLLTLGAPLVRAVKTSMLKDVHLMIEEPLSHLAEFAAAGADLITVQAESTRHLHRTLQALGTLTNANDPARGILRGLALNPGTPLQVVEPVIAELDVICLLAVNPGWSGQRFIPATRERAARALDLIRASGRDILLSIDGGITRANIADAVRMGADIVVTGSAVFDGQDWEENARQLLQAAAQAKAR